LEGFVAAARAGTPQPLLQQMPARRADPAAARRRNWRSKAVAWWRASDQRVIVRIITFGGRSGSGVGVIGPSGSGKSSLIRALVGVWMPARGRCVDGAALDQWSSDVLGVMSATAQ